MWNGEGDKEFMSRKMIIEEGSDDNYDIEMCVKGANRGVSMLNATPSKLPSDLSNRLAGNPSNKELHDQYDQHDQHDQFNNTNRGASRSFDSTDSGEYSTASEDEKDKTTPEFPWLAMIALCTGMLAHSVVFTNPLPYVAFMVVDFGMADTVDNAGYYAGWITGTFMIGEIRVNSFSVCVSLCVYMCVPLCVRRERERVHANVLHVLSMCVCITTVFSYVAHRHIHDR